MSTTQDTTQQKPAETGAGGCCMSDREPQAGNSVEAAKGPPAEAAGTKKLAPTAAKGGGCGCGS